MERSPAVGRLARLLVVVYLCFAGWFLILAPWSGFWGELVIPNAPWWMLRLVDSPAVRGALAAFGALHFAVAASWLAVGAARSG